MFAKVIERARNHFKMLISIGGAVVLLGSWAGGMDKIINFYYKITGQGDPHLSISNVTAEEIIDDETAGGFYVHYTMHKAWGVIVSSCSLSFVSGPDVEVISNGAGSRTFDAPGRDTSKRVLQAFFVATDAKGRATNNEVELTEEQEARLDGRLRYSGTAFLNCSQGSTSGVAKISIP